MVERMVIRHPKIPTHSKNMSDQDNDNPQAPMKKTSAVPLKKETVRVTLKADPEHPSAAPSAPSAPTPPTATAPAGAPRPPAPAPTIALRTAAGTTNTVPKPAPTIALRTGPIAAGAPTVPLTTGNQGLPKATVQLDKSQPLPPPSASATAGQTPTLVMSKDDEEEEPSDTIPTVFSILSFVAALAVLGLGISTWLADKTHAVGDLFS